MRSQREPVGRNTLSAHVLFCVLPPLPVLNLNLFARSPFLRTVLEIIIYNTESGAYKKLM